MNEETINILLVEDNPGDARLLENMLSSEEAGAFGIVKATRLNDAARLLEERRFDAVMLDLSLPDSSGVDTVDRTRALAEAQRIPIIVVTGMLNDKVAAAAVQHGAQEALQKQDLDGARLIHTLRVALQRKQAQNREEDTASHAKQAKELEGLDTLSGESYAGTMAGSNEPDPLSRSARATFDRLQERYGELIDQAIEERVYRVDHDIGKALYGIIQTVGALRGGPRDIVEMHTTVTRRKLQGLPAKRAEFVLTEGRLLLIQLLGLLATYYRRRESRRQNRRDRVRAAS